MNVYVTKLQFRIVNTQWPRPEHFPTEKVKIAPCESFVFGKQYLPLTTLSARKKEKIIETQQGKFEKF